MSLNYNQYIGIIAASQEEACVKAMEVGYDPLEDKLVHVEPPTEPGEELPTYVFTVMNEVQSDFDDWEMLHDHFDLPWLPNLPYEEIP